MTQNFTSILFWDFCGCVFQTEMKMSFSSKNPKHKLKDNDYVLGLFHSVNVISDIDALVQAECLVFLACLLL